MCTRNNLRHEQRSLFSLDITGDAAFPAFGSFARLRRAHIHATSPHLERERNEQPTVFEGVHLTVPSVSSLVSTAPLQGALEPRHALSYTQKNMRCVSLGSQVTPPLGPGDQGRIISKDGSALALEMHRAKGSSSESISQSRVLGILRPPPALPHRRQSSSQSA